MIPFSKPCAFDNGPKYIENVLKSGRLSGQGPYTNLCTQYLEKTLQVSGKVILTTSGTSALEMAAMVLIKPGDEVILPSFTFVSTVNAFASRGAVPVFIDIESETMNMDATLISAAITPKCRAIVPVHYAGISCDMDSILAIAKEHNLFVIEDAAQGLSSSYKGIALGTMGHLGCISFHETKNVTSGGQGGALIVNDESLVADAEIVYDNGTNRSQFMRDEVENYTWQKVGSNFILSEVLSALLWSQLEQAERIQEKRVAIWNKYIDQLMPISTRTGRFTLSQVPQGCQNNGHIFYLKLTQLTERDEFIMYMKGKGIMVLPHFLPLHSTEIGRRAGQFIGYDANTTLGSLQLVRLPVYYDLSDHDQDMVISAIRSFFLPEKVSLRGH